jgi:hypothetical protein
MESTMPQTARYIAMDLATAADILYRVSQFYHAMALLTPATAQYPSLEELPKSVFSHTLKAMEIPESSDAGKALLEAVVEGSLKSVESALSLINQARIFCSSGEIGEELGKLMFSQ